VVDDPKVEYGLLAGKEAKHNRPGLHGAIIDMNNMIQSQPLPLEVTHNIV
jgi:hypothetical protein